MKTKKKNEYCKICGLPGETKCTFQANCLNIPLEAEIKYLSKNKTNKHETSNNSNSN